MPNNKVLVIGMIDSIHLARWLTQFIDTDNQIRVFPSTHFRLAHKRMYEFERTNIQLLGLHTFKNLLGYFDSIVTLRFFGDKVGQLFRQFYLSLYIMCYRPNIIHAIEIQHAGYLVASIKKGPERRILTNWGSDIYFFQHIQGHEARIKQSLEWATHYSAECARDYVLARSLGFRGIDLEKIPNAGGFIPVTANQQSLANRNQLIVKCYGGTFGLGSLAINVCEKFLDTFVWSKVYLYSVTSDLLKEVENLASLHPGRVRFSTLDAPLDHEAILEEFKKSRVYLGLSRSDGLSTSFLEALLFGAYPIQSDTSCANELIELGATGSIVVPEFDAVLKELLKVFGDEIKLQKASEANNVVAGKFLDYDYIQKIAMTYYE
jgi:hypothetical protein